MLNVGAGAGSYEPTDRVVVAVEPSQRMIDQRPSEASRIVVRAFASELPFDDDTFDAAMALLTVHHWPDAADGLARSAPRDRRACRRAHLRPRRARHPVARDRLPARDGRVRRRRARHPRRSPTRWAAERYRSSRCRPTAATASATRGGGDPTPTSTLGSVPASRASLGYRPTWWTRRWRASPTISRPVVGTPRTRACSTNPRSTRAIDSWCLEGTATERARLRILRRWRSTEAAEPGLRVGASDAWIASSTISAISNGPRSGWRGTAVRTAGRRTSHSSETASSRFAWRALHPRQHRAGMPLVQHEQVQRRSHRLAPAQATRRERLSLAPP